jgi:flagellar basal-body rod protein FlgB
MADGALAPPAGDQRQHREHRHTGYVAKEVPFEQELQRAIGTGSSRLATTDARHIAASSSRNQLGMQAAQALTSQRRDDNSVDIDQQMVSLAETQMRYQAAASALNTKIATLRNVIRGPSPVSGGQ